MSKLFDTANVKILHIEPTSMCNAACPQCNRESSLFFNKEINNSELTLHKIKTLFSVDFIKQLDKMFMCGNFGEPAVASECIEIFRYFKEINPEITVGMNTNGSIRNTEWWKELASVFTGKYDYVVFSIDGLEDTNHIYRKNTVWSKIINNVGAFIQSGGIAQWDMLVFGHNEHQVDAAKKLARDLGFCWFRAKVSKRFVATPITFLNPPKNYQLPNVAPSNKINCHALNEQSIYVGANGHILPCCWFGAELFTLDDYAAELLSDWNQLPVSWTTNPHRICSATCSTDIEGTSFSKQWKIEEQLK